MRGVILDLASLGPAELDFAPVLGQLEGWDLHESTAHQDLPARLAEAEVVLCNKTPLDAESLQRAPRLRLIVVMATGTNNIDLTAAKARGVVVCNARGYAEASVAEHTMMVMLALARGLVCYREDIAAGAWSRSPHFSLHLHPVMELQGSRLGIIGFGGLGRAVAERAAAFGMDIALAALPGRNSPAAPHPRKPLDELLGWVDVLSIHCPLSPQTHGLIGRAELARMRRGSLLVNAARGGILDEQALLEALEAGHLGGAAIDTLEVEPPPADSPLLRADLPNLLLTPHNAWASRAARQRLVNQLGEVIAAWRAGAPINRVA